VLESVMLRLRQDVEAEDALEERRVAEGEDAFLLVTEFEAERDQSTFRVSAACVKRG
jgi:hypothetical protein